MQQLKPPWRSNPSSRALWAAVAYVVAGSLWIVYSDRMLTALIADPSTLTEFQTYKDWLFIAVTAFFLYLLLRMPSPEIEDIAPRATGAPLPGPRGTVAHSGQFNDLLVAPVVGERRFRETLENVHLIAIALDVHGTVTFCNDFLLKLSGWRREELLGLNFFDAMLPDSAPVRVVFDDAILSGNVPPHYENAIRTRRGESRIIRWSNTILRDPANRIIGIFSLGEDITERKQSEQALRDSEQRFRLAASTGNVWDWNFLTNEVAFPSEHWRMLGYEEPEGEFSPDMLEAIMHPDDRPRWRQAIKDHITRRLPYELDFRARTKSGEYRWFSTKGQARWDENGRATYMAGTTFDITERKRAEEQLKKAEQRFRKLFDNASVGIIVCNLIRDENGKIIDYMHVEANKALRKHTGITESDVIGKRCSEVIPPEETALFIRRLTEVLETGTPYSYEQYFPSLGRTIEHRPFMIENGMFALTFFDITERKRAEQALRKSEENYRQLFQANPHPMWAYDLETLRFLAVNDAAVANYGYSRDEFLSMTIADIRPAEDVPRLRKNVALVKDAGIDAAGLWRHRKRDGTLIDVEITSHVLDFLGRRAEIVLARDVSERRAAEARIQRLTQLYAALSQCNEAIVRCANEDELFAQVCRATVQAGGMKSARISLVDPRTRTIRIAAGFGFDNEDLKNMVIPLDADDPRGRGPSATAIREDRPYWCQDFLNDPATAPWLERGLRFGWGAVAALPLHRNGSVIGAFIVFDGEANAFDAPRRELLLEMATDISFALDNFERDSRRRQAEEALRESDTRYRELFERNPLPILAIDLETLGFLAINQAAIEKYGYSREEFLAMGIADLRVPEDRARLVANLRERYLRSPDEISRVEGRHVTKSGQIIFCEVVAQPLKLGGRRARLISVSDVTERRLLEAELRRANEELEQRVSERTHALQAANRDLEAFSYSVSHDLRAPLRAINGFGHLIEDEFAVQLGERGRELLGRVRAGAERMGHLIDDLLKLSQISRQTIHVSPVDLSALVREVADELQMGEPRRHVEWAIAPDVAAQGDAGLLKVALQNLIGNAWKYSSKREAARIEFGVGEKNGRTHYFVRDNGAGFDMAYVQNLFGAFQRLHSTAEFPGSGIGLATVARIIRRHGGEVWAEGRVGAGASFYFTLAC